MSLALVQDLQTALKAGDLAAATRHAETLDQLMPGRDDVRGTLAALYLAAKDWPRALVALQQLPVDVDRLHGMALACQHLGRLDEALGHLQRVLELSPGDPHALRRLLALTPGAPKLKRSPHAADNALRAGDLKRGFRLFAEFMAQQADPAHLPRAGLLPRWRGERVDHLLVLGMAGDGDTLQFCRYLPDAAKRCRRLTVAVSTQLVRLLRDRFPADVISVVGSGEIAADVQIEMMLLPHAIGATYGTTGRYIHADVPRDYGPGFHVGINWIASDEDGNVRTVPVDTLAPLAAVPGVTFHNLVFGPRAADAPAWIQPLQLGDYADTANAYAGLDLIITVDSSPAHLAGALGLPVWVALPGPRADWRFETHAHRWRWYDSARLFRGPRCFEAMAARLAPD